MRVRTVIYVGGYYKRLFWTKNCSFDRSGTLGYYPIGIPALRLIDHAVAKKLVRIGLIKNCRFGVHLVKESASYWFSFQPDKVFRAGFRLYHAAATNKQKAKRQKIFFHVHILCCCFNYNINQKLFKFNIAPDFFLNMTIICRRIDFAFYRIWPKL